MGGWGAPITYCIVVLRLDNSHDELRHADSEHRRLSLLVLIVAIPSGVDTTGCVRVTSQQAYSSSRLNEAEVRER